MGTELKEARWPIAREKDDMIRVLIGVFFWSYVFYDLPLLVLVGGLRWLHF